jgi:hypothetical protein
MNHPIHVPSVFLSAFMPCVAPTPVKELRQIHETWRTSAAVFKNLPLEQARRQNCRGPNNISS